MTTIPQFISRHAKASDPSNPFPWDRVFPSNSDLNQFGNDLRTFCEGYEANMETLARVTAERDKLQEQITAMQV